MNKLKKVLSLFLMMTMFAMLSIPAFAQESTPTTTINITGNNDTSTFVAYKLLNSTDDGKNHIAYTLNSKYTDILKNIMTTDDSSKTQESDIIPYIQDELNSSDKIRTFADAVYAQVKNMTVDETSNGNTFANVSQGYYLIAEKTTNGSYSVVMLDTAGKTNTNVTIKKDMPTVEKKVTCATSELQDAADYDIGDAVPFTLTGTIDQNINSYSSYAYTFRDTLSTGLTLNEDSLVVNVVKENNTVYKTLKKGTDWTFTSTTNNFTIAIDNLKNYISSPSDKVVVKYTATLNENAVIGSAGNSNKVELIYSNNPYDEDSHSNTPPTDVVKVYTYQVVVYKTDGTNPLKGAGFTLYKKNSNNDYIEVTDKLTTNTDGTTFTFTGLGSGEYKLVESKVPAGYNKADDIEFTITATYDKNSADPQFNKLTVTGDINNEFTDGIVTTTVVNKSGSKLPSTGGMGTTIFYVIGGVLMAGAVILLITKKKCQENN